MVTGASSGIGHATVLRLARSGFLVFAGVRNPNDADRIHHEGGERVVPLQIDVTDDASIRSAVDRVCAHLDSRGLDGLVNNAGIGVVAPLEHIRADVLRRQFAPPAARRTARPDPLPAFPAAGRGALTP